MVALVPDLSVERALLSGLPRGALLACVDEVGRGALAGPVTVGVVVLDAARIEGPGIDGVRDSKLMTPAQRERCAPRVREWVSAWAVGDASPREIDSVGIMTALRRAAERALSNLPATHVVLLDGSHNWLTRRTATAPLEDPHPDHDDTHDAAPTVHTRVKADLQCMGVAAASVLAKVHRDALMLQAHHEHPEYGWAENKGYAAPAHREALTRLGVTPWHRRSWRLLETD